VVKGLDVFQHHFARYANQYVLIGGTAATLAMEEAGLEFRATKDLDIVLHIEALNAEFATAFWAFVEQGEYEIRHASKTGKPVLYRFQKPKNERFPAMLELFCRSPDGMVLAARSQLTPIPIEDEAASLSAILLDDAYYAFIIAGRKERDGLRWIGEEQLIPLKARAWLDLNARRALGEPIDAKNIRKHGNDVLRLSQMLAPDSRIKVAAKIAEDLDRFLGRLITDGSYDPKSVGVNVNLAELVGRIKRAYQISSNES
jgi:hypothetical protein